MTPDHPYHKKAKDSQRDDDFNRMVYEASNSVYVITLTTNDVTDQFVAVFDCERVAKEYAKEYATCSTIDTEIDISDDELSYTYADGCSFTVKQTLYGDRKRYQTMKEQMANLPPREEILKRMKRFCKEPNEK